VSYLLDTNVVSEIRKGARANGAVMQWISDVKEEDLHLSVLVVGELRQGVERLRTRDAASAERLDRWLRRLAEGYEGRILPVDESVAQVWGRLNVPDPLPAVDGLLAATALVHDLTLVTRNKRDVARTGARLLNPFEGGSKR
jgi:predicted nucleic acid-binding protein